MKGRIEHGLLVDEKIQQKLCDLPSCVSDYYYAISVSTEPHTRKEYILKLESFLKYVEKDIEDITEEDVVRYFHDLNVTAETKKGKLLSSSYQQLIWTALNKFFSYAERKGLIFSNPMKGCEYPKSKDRHTNVYLKPEELRKTMNAVSKEREKYDGLRSRDVLILYMLMNTGMRSEMLCEINISDLDYDRMMFTVIAKGRKEMEYRITPKMMDYITDWLLQRTHYLNKNSGDALFINRRGDRLSYQSVRRIVKQYTKASGKEVTPHKLRASFITNYYEASGHDLEATRIAGGHEYIETTKRYIGGKEQSRYDAQNFMDDIL